MAEIVLGSPMLWTAFLLPIVAGIVSGIAGKAFSARAHVGLAGFSWLLSLILILSLAPLIYSDASGVESLRAASERVVVVLDPVYARVPVLGSLALFLDGISLPLAIAIASVSLGVIVYSYRYMEHRFEEMGVEQWGLYTLLYQLFTAGMLGVVMANNTILFYLFLELTLIPSFLLIALYGYGDRVRVGLLYLVWTHIGAAMFLVGVLLTGMYSSFVVYEPGLGYVTGVEGLIPWNVAAAAFLLMLLGLAVKAAMFGFHIWLPYAHAEAPTPISALLSPLLIGLGAYGMLRILVDFYPTLWSTMTPFLVAWAFVTMLYGGFLAYSQRDVKRFLAYSSVSQMGYLMLGLATATYAGYAGAMLHYVSHAYGKALLFAVAGILIVTIHTRDMEKMGGLAAKLPYAAAMALLGFLFLTGIPPTLGFLSEYLIARGLAEWAAPQGPAAFSAALLVFMAAVAMTTIYSFVGFKRMFLSKPGEAYQHVSRGEYSSMVAPLVFMGMLGVVMFVFPEPLLAPLKLAALLLAG